MLGASTFQMLLLALAVGCGTPALIYLLLGSRRQPQAENVKSEHSRNVIPQQLAAPQTPRRPIMPTDLYDLENPPLPKHVKATVVGFLEADNYRPFPVKMTVHVPADFIQKLVRKETLKQAGFDVSEVNGDVTGDREVPPKNEKALEPARKQRKQLIRRVGA